MNSSFRRPKTRPTLNPLLQPIYEKIKPFDGLERDIWAGRLPTLIHLVHQTIFDVADNLGTPIIGSHFSQCLSRNYAILTVAGWEAISESDMIDFFDACLGVMEQHVEDQHYTGILFNQENILKNLN